MDCSYQYHRQNLPFLLLRPAQAYLFQVAVLHYFLRYTMLIWMFCFGRTCNAFPAEVVWLHIHMVKSTSPLPNSTGEKPSGCDRGENLVPACSLVGLTPWVCSVPAWTPGLASSWEKPLKIPGFWKLDFVACLCYSSCSWGEWVELGQSCWAQVLSILLLQQESHTMETG